MDLLNTRYSHKEIEDSIYQFWLQQNLFQAKLNPSREPFTIVIPPPNITGILHMGHALNNTIQDVLIRFNRMFGKEALWMPGTDHAGIATQNVVERALAKEGLRKEDIGREKFLERLWQWKNEYGSRILMQLRKLGASCDWERTRFTMDNEYIQAVKEAFVHLYKKGLIYRGWYIINWCPRCKTALSDEESPYREISGKLYYIRYIVKGTEKKWVVVATTRPETMLGDTAIAINPYDERYRWLKADNVEVILPIVERKLTVIEDEIVDTSFGTGVVKVTPAHDPADFILGKKYNLEFINIMNDDATLNFPSSEFSGLDRFEARKRIIEILKEKGLLEKEEDYKINAGHCYRCDTLIEPRLSLQWFVRMQPLAEKAINVVEEDKIRFYPQRWKKVYLNWMYNIKDWCISRQIWWGHRIPVWYCNDCYPSGSLADVAISQQRGIIVSTETPVECPYCGGKNLEQDKDVLDTWFSSWLWPFATFYWPFKNLKDSEQRVKEFNYFYPTNVLVTASEILFFWVARMIMAGLEFTGKIPFTDVLIHGTVRDEKGIKMSKSLGNIIDPLEIIDEVGADALRFSLMFICSSGSDAYLSREKFLVGRNFCNKLWNAARFILINIDKNNLDIDNLFLKNLNFVDRWILSELYKTIDIVTNSLRSYDINAGIVRIYEFFWHILCDWYLEIIKDNFNQDKAKVALLCLLDSLKLSHPFIPFITEKIFNFIREKFISLELPESIMISSWPEGKYLPDYSGKEINFARVLIDLIKQIRTLKMDLGLKPTEKVGVVFKVKGEYRHLIEENKSWIARLANLDRIELSDNLSRIIFETELISLDFIVENIDLQTLIVSLNKRYEENKNLFERVSQRLKNNNFLEKAPRNIVEAEKEKFSRLEDIVKRLEKLKDVFERKS